MPNRTRLPILLVATFLLALSVGCGPRSGLILVVGDDSDVEFDLLRVVLHIGDGQAHTSRPLPRQDDGPITMETDVKAGQRVAFEALGCEPGTACNPEDVIVRGCSQGAVVPAGSQAVVSIDVTEAGARPCVEEFASSTVRPDAESAEIVIDLSRI